MKVIALEAYLAKLVDHLDASGQILAAYLGQPGKLNSISSKEMPIGTSGSESITIDQKKISKKLLVELSPDLILSSRSVTANNNEFLEQVPIASDWLELLPENCKIISYAPARLDEVYALIIDVAKRIGVPQIGADLTSRIKAQIVNWCDNFYDRTKRKKVTFISSVEPLELAGLWIPDMINLTSAQSQVAAVGLPAKAVKWQEILGFKPDVIIVAPRGVSRDQAFSTFKYLEQQPNWEEIPAVKRGEVYFCGGDTLFYQPAVNVTDSMGMIVSAIAGFDSGYITERDSYQRLRWLEMQRHRY